MRSALQLFLASPVKITYRSIISVSALTAIPRVLVIFYTSRCVVRKRRGVEVAMCEVIKAWATFRWRRGQPDASDIPNQFIA